MWCERSVARFWGGREERRGELWNYAVVVFFSLCCLRSLDEGFCLMNLLLGGVIESIDWYSL